MDSSTDTAMPTHTPTGTGHPGSNVQMKPEPTIQDIANDVGESLSAYAKKRPEVVAMWSFGIGFVLAWKLKPW